MNDKTPFEIRRTRLDVILKLFYAFIAVAGAILVLFADPKNEKLINGYVVFLGLETLLFVLLFKMAVYIYNEIRCFQEKSENLNTYIEKADKSYKKI